MENKSPSSDEKPNYNLQDYPGMRQRKSYEEAPRRLDRGMMNPFQYEASRSAYYPELAGSSRGHKHGRDHKEKKEQLRKRRERHQDNLKGQRLIDDSGKLRRYPNDIMEEESETPVKIMDSMSGATETSIMSASELYRNPAMVSKEEQPGGSSGKFSSDGEKFPSASKGLTGAYAFHTSEVRPREPKPAVTTTAAHASVPPQQTKFPATPKGLEEKSSSFEYDSKLYEALEKVRKGKRKIPSGSSLILSVKEPPRQYRSKNIFTTHQPFIGFSFMKRKKKCPPVYEPEELLVRHRYRMLFLQLYYLLIASLIGVGMISGHTYYFTRTIYDILFRMKSLHTPFGNMSLNYDLWMEIFLNPRLLSSPYKAGIPFMESDEDETETQNPPTTKKPSQWSKDLETGQGADERAYDDTDNDLPEPIKTEATTPVLLEEEVLGVDQVTDKPPAVIFWEEEPKFTEAPIVDKEDDDFSLYAEPKREKDYTVENDGMNSEDAPREGVEYEEEEEEDYDYASTPLTTVKASTVTQRTDTDEEALEPNSELPGRTTKATTYSPIVRFTNQPKKGHTHKMRKTIAPHVIWFHSTSKRKVKTMRPITMSSKTVRSSEKSQTGKGAVTQRIVHKLGKKPKDQAKLSDEQQLKGEESAPLQHANDANTTAERAKSDADASGKADEEADPSSAKINSEAKKLSLAELKDSLFPSIENSEDLERVKKQIMLLNYRRPYPGCCGKTLEECYTVHDFWTFMQSTLSLIMYFNYWYDLKVPPLHAPVGDKRYFYENQIVSHCRVRQLRVKKNSCFIHPWMANSFSLCYAAYSSSTEDTSPINTDLRSASTPSAWVYSPKDVTNSSSFWGRFGYYGGGGYYFDLGPSVNLTVHKIRDLRENKWVDRGTRAVIAEFTIYNPNINNFMVCRIVFEFAACGGVFPFADFTAVKLIRYLDKWDFFILGCEFFFILYTFALLGEYFGYWIKNNIKIWGSPMPTFTLFVFLFAFATICCGVARHFVVSAFLKEIHGGPIEFYNFIGVRDIQILFNTMVATLVFLIWMQTMQFFNVSQIFLELSSALRRSLGDLIAFSLLIFLSFIAFAQVGFLLFGHRVFGFRDVWNSFFTLLEGAVGNINYQHMEEASRFLAPVFFILFVFFMVFIFMNMFIAIVMNAYTMVRGEINPRQKKINTYSALGAKNFLGCLTCGLTNNWFSTPYRQNTYEQLRYVLRRAGFTDTEVDIFFDKYNINENQLMHETENKKIIENLEIRNLDYSQTLEQAQIYDLRRRLDRLADTVQDLQRNLQPSIDKIDLIMTRLTL